MNLGATDDLIAKAEEALGVRFPEGLRRVWRISNGLELPGGWRFFPVFDPKEPRKTCSHIGYENSKSRWSCMAENLISIAGGDTGNRLVLESDGVRLGDTILLWNHETNRTRKWGKGFDYIMGKAESRVARIEKQMARSLKRKDT